MTEELLKLQTYGRLFQRLASTKQLVPLGIYRTVPVASCPEIGVRETVLVSMFVCSQAALFTLC